MKYLILLTLTLFVVTNALSVAYSKPGAVLLEEHNKCVDDFNECRALLEGSEKTLEKCEKVLEEAKREARKKCPKDYKTPIITGGTGFTLGMLLILILLL
jgi:hypothetical protein